VADRITLTGLTATVTSWQTVTDNADDLPPAVAVAPTATAYENAGNALVPASLDFTASNDATSTQRIITAKYATANGTAATPPKPIRTLPSRDFTEHGATGLEVFVQRRASHAARGSHLAIGKVICVKKAKRFGDAFLQVRTVLLEWLSAADIDLPQVEGRLAVIHPLRERKAGAAGR
jgi:hypothetical protein